MPWYDRVGTVKKLASLMGMMLILMMGSIIGLPAGGTFKLAPASMLHATGADFPNFTITEAGGISRTGEPVTAEVKDLPQGEAFHDSIRLYQNDTEVVSQVWNKVNHASETFYSDSQLKIPDEWKVGSLVTDTRIFLLSHFKGWKDVLCISDNTDSWGASIRREFSSSESKIQGSVEILINVKQEDEDFIISLGEQSTSRIRYLFAEDGTIKRWTGTSYIPLDDITTYIKDTWYFLKIVWDCDANISRFYLNRTLKDESEFGVPANKIMTVAFGTDSPSKADAYIAAVDFSFAPGYEEGRIQTLKSCSVSFLASSEPNATTTYTVRYANTSQGDPGYPVPFSEVDLLVTDGNGAQWNFLAVPNNINVGKYVEDPSDNNIYQYWGTTKSISIADWARPIEKGPIFITMFRQDVYHVHYWEQRIFKNSYSKILFLDGQAQAIRYDTSAYYFDYSELHYRVNGSWIVKDPLYGNPFATTTYDGMILDNNDGLPWIHALVVNTTQPGMQYLRGAETSGIYGYHLGGGEQLLANITYEYWSCLLNVGTNVTAQQEAVSDLHLKMILHPLEAKFPYTPPLILPDYTDLIILVTFIIVTGALVGVVSVGYYKKFGELRSMGNKQKLKASGNGVVLA